MLMREVGSSRDVRARPARVCDRRGRLPLTGEQKSQLGWFMRPAVSGCPRLRWRDPRSPAG
jgi:hypothetical protein